MLHPVSSVLVGLVGLEHAYILYLEMFAWTRPRTLKIFGTSPDLAARTGSMAANQGLYNGFLAAGLFWSILHPNKDFGRQLAWFFCGCVGVAAVYGAATVKASILRLQGGPAALAMVSLLLLK
ncbi:hypothetical protein DFJ74DRAFT_672840 [Hyaloraphidium curvatum]|nr:hypothetical protein DFJ74DRAFT_672840 [Hyaloraphidium curvatum]